MAGVFDRMANNLKAFNLNQYLGDWIVDNEDFITGLNKRRLFEKGTDVEGKKIFTYQAQLEGGRNKYAARTIHGAPTFEGKKEKGQIWKHVTLNDTGAFYDSFSVVNKANSFSIEGDDDKSEGQISDNVNLTLALGLDNNGIEAIRGRILPDLRKEVLSILRS